MNRTKVFFSIAPLLLLTIVSCNGESGGESAVPEPGWSVPGFTTDFSRILVDPAEIFSGGPPKDGIPAVDAPQHVTIEIAAAQIPGDEPVIVVTAGDDAVIYPLRILTWHEIVNDSVGGIPLAVTFCPLCNTSIVFDRRMGNVVLDFGTTGRLLGSNLLMYDRQSETWWQQATGEGIIGLHAGEQLGIRPSRTLSFNEAVEAEPEARVLSQDTGYSRPYGSNPYEGYDEPEARPFLFSGPMDESHPPLSRALTVRHGGSEKLVPWDDVETAKVLNITLDGTEIVLFHSGNARSALDTPRIADGRVTGSINAYIARDDDTVLQFSVAENGNFIDTISGSEWTGAGIAVAGPLAGTELEGVVAINHFWFSGAYFRR